MFISSTWGKIATAKFEFDTPQHNVTMKHQIYCLFTLRALILRGILKYFLFFIFCDIAPALPLRLESDSFESYCRLGKIQRKKQRTNCIKETRIAHSQIQKLNIPDNIYNLHIYMYACQILRDEMCNECAHYNGNSPKIFVIKLPSGV